MKRFGITMLGLALIALTTGCQCGRYGSCGSCNYGPTMGYNNVISMDGGFSGWKAAEYEIETE